MEYEEWKNGKMEKWKNGKMEKRKKGEMDRRNEEKRASAKSASLVFIIKIWRENHKKENYYRNFTFLFCCFSSSSSIFR